MGGKYYRGTARVYPVEGINDLREMMHFRTAVPFSRVIRTVRTKGSLQTLPVGFASDIAELCRTYPSCQSDSPKNHQGLNGIGFMSM